MQFPDLSNRRAIALDGGTSTTRARLIDGGRIVAESRRAVGVRDTVLSGGRSPLEDAVRTCLEDLAAQVPGAQDLPIIAAGMLSAEVGLVGVPHVSTPAGLKELAAGARSIVIPGISDRPILFIPGVKTPPTEGPNGWFDADLMRGEEAETLGAMIALGLRGPVAFLWPGSHTKLVEVDAQGRIVRSYTTLTGEMTSALAQGTLIAKSLPPSLPDHPDLDAIALGISATREGGIGRAAFLVRVADITGTLPPEHRAAFWIGAVIGDDVAGLVRHAILASGIPIWVGGREPQRSLYANQLEQVYSGEVRSLDDRLADRASALGAVAVAEWATH